MTQQNSKYPSTFYRVSLKAIIRNPQGQVLAVKSNTDLFNGTWDLPGGGMEHGDDELSTLAKEFYEEALIDAPITAYRLLGMEPRYTAHKQAWWLGVFYEVVLPDGFAYGIGQDSSDVRFIDPLEFKDSEHITEQLLYRWSMRLINE